MIGVRREWTHPARSNGAYYDLAILELGKFNLFWYIYFVILISLHKNTERRIIYDYETYGDSPYCLGKNKLVPDQLALQEGVGLTEKDNLLGLRVVEVDIIQNEKCYEKIESANTINLHLYKQELPLGINAGIMCTLGIVNSEGILQVSHWSTGHLYRA